ncbi:protein FAM83A-like [Mastacembelus armatus]|uniref:protein FAM83A-like n=1 Tax=Mastacembelus armatus TaxID=205130 RepID=UPI000E453D50|nr:protein FAM83A-like [Mastacembelus armatus]
MDGSSVAVLWYRKFRPMGKVRRRVQDLRIPSSHHCDFIHASDLSHNESTRLAVDCLLSQGLDGYHEVLNAEGEVDFLSEPEKNYILENGRDGNTANPDASDDDGTDFESLAAGSHSHTQCFALATDSEPIVADVTDSDPVLDQPNVEVYFQTDSRAAGMKDLVREFIRKAKMALVVVLDSFSDVELLCDLLEASRKRNVSVHVLLDHLNLNLFVSMWQDLKLNSKNFPKLSVRSVDGQTYCAKTGRKLRGQIAESFILTDWTEVLTGSYSFSWLSWQVHRSLAVLVKGSAVTPFQQEFTRLYSSSKPVPGFVTFITVPPTLPFYSSSHAAQSKTTGIRISKSSQTKATYHWTWTDDVRNSQTKANMQTFSSPQIPEQECSHHRAGIGAQNPTKPPQWYLKPLVQPGAVQSVSVKKPKQTVGRVSTQYDVQTYVEKDQNQIQSHSSLLGQTHSCNIQSQLASLCIGTTTEQNTRVQESNRLRTVTLTHRAHRTLCYQSALNKDSNPDQVCNEGLFFRRRNGNRLTKPSGTAAIQNTHRGQWNYSLNLKPKVELQCDFPKLQSVYTTQHEQAKTSLHFPFSHSRRNTSDLETNVYSLGTRRHDHCQPHLQSHPNTDSPGLNSTSAAIGTHLKPQLKTDLRELFLSDTSYLVPGTRAKLQPQPLTSQQAKPPPRLNWTPQSHTTRPRPVTRTSSFDTTYRTEQKSWRPLHNNMTSLGRSKSLTERCQGRINPKC